MGTSSYGPYSGTSTGSQPYAEKYHVVPKLLNMDKKDPDIYSPTTGYFKNPTAKTLEESITSKSFFMEGRKANGVYTYALDNDGNIIYGIRCNPINPIKRSPHPTLIGGKDPTVQCAGMIEFRNGKIYSVNNQSGHYRPDIKSLSKVTTILQNLYDKRPELFHRQSEWRKSK